MKIAKLTLIAAIALFLLIPTQRGMAEDTWTAECPITEYKKQGFEGLGTFWWWAEVYKEGIKCKKFIFKNTIKMYNDKLSINYSTEKEKLVVTVADDFNQYWEHPIIDIQGNSSLTFNSVSFEDLIVADLRVRASAALYLIKSDFINSFASIHLESGGTLFCLACDMQSSGMTIKGKANVVSGKFTETAFVGKFYSPMTINSDEMVSIGNNEFYLLNPDNDSPYITIKKGKNVDIAENSFELSSNSKIAIDISDPEPSDVIMITDNKYYNNAGDIDLAAVVTADPQSKMSKLDVPLIEYSGLTDNKYKINILNEIGENDGKAYWGKSSNLCPTNKLRGALFGIIGGEKKYLRIEPYLIMKEKMLPIGYYDYKTESDGKRYITIPANLKVEDIAPDKEVLVAGGKIAIQVLCEGNGTTKFSNAVYLPLPEMAGGSGMWGGFSGFGKDFADAFNKAAQEYAKIIEEAGKAVAKAICTKDADCKDNKKCVNNFCVQEPGVAGAECDANKKCNLGYECKEAKCTKYDTPLKPKCAANTDCGIDEECISGECIAQQKSEPECKVDTECGENGLCVKGKCQIWSIDKNCSEGEEFNEQLGICLKKSETEPAPTKAKVGGGGCSLIR